MKFKIDENLPVELGDLLRSAEHDAHSVHDEEMVGEPDETIISVCKKEERCLITLDLDFSDVRSYPPAHFAGIVVFRLRRQDKQHVMKIAGRLTPLLESEKLAGTLWIVEEDRVRIRDGE